MTRRFTIALLILAAVISSAGAQEQRVFAPFVSRLWAEIDEDRAILSWKDSTDTDGTYLVYRHDRPIDETTFPDAVLAGNVPPGSERFVDAPPPGREYFYAVVATDADGSRYPFFVPFRNATRRGVSVREIPLEKRAAHVGGLRARVNGGAVELSFAPSRSDRSLVVFRSTSPIRSPRDISESIALGAVASSSDRFLDYPIPGISYYYAVLDEALVDHDLASPEPGANATTEAAVVPPQEERIGLPAPPPAREIMPLPFLRIDSNLSTGESLAASLPPGTPIRGELAADAAEATRRLLASIPAREPEPMRPVALPPERGAPLDGESRTLHHLVRETLLPGEWDRADEYLRSFRSVPRSAAVEARVGFYLGQALYFRGMYREAFMEFLRAEERYYPHVRPWLQAVIRRLADRER